MTIARILKFTAVGLAVCILPLFIVGMLDPSSNPVGLGLLMVIGTPIVLVLGASAIGLRIVQIWWNTR